MANNVYQDNLHHHVGLQATWKGHEVNSIGKVE